MLKQIRILKEPKIVLDKAQITALDVCDTTQKGFVDICVQFNDALINSLDQKPYQGTASLTIHNVALSDIKIMYFTDTTPHQRVSLSQFKSDIRQLKVEVKKEYYNHHEVFISAQIDRAQKPLFIGLEIPHHGEVHYHYQK